MIQSSQQVWFPVCCQSRLNPVFSGELRGVRGRRHLPTKSSWIEITLASKQETEPVDWLNHGIKVFDCAFYGLPSNAA